MQEFVVVRHTDAMIEVEDTATGHQFTWMVAKLDAGDRVLSPGGSVRQQADADESAIRIAHLARVFADQEALQLGIVDRLSPW